MNMILKGFAVIEQCKTEEQMLGARKYLDLLISQHIAADTNRILLERAYDKQLVSVYKFSSV